MNTQTPSLTTRHRTGDHLDVHTKLERALDRALGVGARGIQEGQDTHHVPVALVVRLGYRERADAPQTQLGDLELNGLFNFNLVLDELEDDVGSALGDLEHLQRGDVK